MKIYQTNKNGDRTSPEFERETDLFIPLGMVLLEIEECSDKKNDNAMRLTAFKEAKTNDYRNC
jgi:hypothetical protein